MSDDINLAVAIQCFLVQAQKVLEKANETLKETSISHFVETKLGMLVGLIDLYKDLYQSVKASGREHLEHMWVKQFRDEEMQDAVNNLLDFEDSWSEFLQLVDQQAKLGLAQGPLLKVGDKLPEDLTVVDSRTDNSKEFSSELFFKSDLANHKCSVVLVSFGALEGAKRWLQETGFSFPLYLDSDRKIYSAFGLPRSIAMAYDWKALSYYGAAKAREEFIPRMFEDIQDDPQQLGGDFIVSNDGVPVISFIYRSADASDRPRVEDILACVQKLKA